MSKFSRIIYSIGFSAIFAGIIINILDKQWITLIWVVCSGCWMLNTYMKERDYYNLVNQFRRYANAINRMGREQ